MSIDEKKGNIIFHGSMLPGKRNILAHVSRIAPNYCAAIETSATQSALPVF